MERRWAKCAALSFAAVGLAPSASAQTASAEVRAEVVSPSKLAEAAAAWLTNSSPGVFTFRIPGSAQSPAITLTTQTPDGSSAAIEFLASSVGSDAVQRLLTQVASGELGPEGIYQLSNAAADGTIGARGVQMILTISDQGGDGRALTATIAFD